MAFTLCSQSPLRLGNASAQRRAPRRIVCRVAAPKADGIAATHDTSQWVADALAVAASANPTEGAASDALDPCLGWDMKACELSGHLKLGKADEDKLAALERAALAQSRNAVKEVQKMKELKAKEGKKL